MTTRLRKTRSHVTKVVWTQEEDSKSLMDRERRKEAIKVKLHRLDGCITRTKKDQEGRFSPLAVVKKIIIIYSKWKLFLCRQELSASLFVDTVQDCSIFSNHLQHPRSRCCKTDEILFWKPIVLHPEEPRGHRAAAGRGERRRAHTLSSTPIAKRSAHFLILFRCRQYSLKLDLLEATHYKLSEVLAGLNGTTTGPFHRFKDSIVKWKDKVRTHLVWRQNTDVDDNRGMFRKKAEGN